MASPELNAALKAAELAINDSQYKDALQHCKAALKADKTSAEALLLIGKAAYYLKEYAQSELAYRRALEAKPGSLEAWQGLAEVFAASGNIAGEIEANEHLLEGTSEEDPRDRAARIRIADAYTRAGALDQAVQQYLQVVSTEDADSPERLDHLSSLADVMLRRDEASVCDEVQQKLEGNAKSPKTTDFEEPTVGPRRTMSCLEVDVLAARAVQDSESGEESVFMVLSEIVERAPPSLKYLQYREEYIRRCLLRIFHAPPRSTDRQQFRLAALRECVSVLCHGGSCSPLPYEAAVWLLEEEEEIKGGQVSVGGQEVGGTQALAGGIQAGAEGHIGAGRQATVALAAENFSRRLIHQFPSHPTARVLLALMLRRHAVHEGQPVSQMRRRQLENLLNSAMEDDSKNDCASGFKALAELQYENRNYEDAVHTSIRGLKWLQQRRERGHEALTQVALGLRLVFAKSLRRLDRLDEAERHFKSLAGWVTEGEAAFSEMCGSTPTSIHQQALRGIALVALARGDVQASRAQYERILGKAALGRGPAEHWAHADYGWLLYQSGDYQGARFQLEQALKVAEEEGCAATDSQVGEHRYRLGEVYWKLKGRYRSDKQFAYHQFVEAAKVEGHAQAPALAALGRYLEHVENRSDAAQKCYRKALAIDPSVDVAGNRRASTDSVGQEE